MDITIFDPWKDFDKIISIWENYLYKKEYSYFLSWGWIENWLFCLPSNTSVKLYVVSENGSPSMIFFLGENKLTRGKIFRSHAYFVNTSGNFEYDLPLWIEYNSIPLLKHNNFSLESFFSVISDNWEEIFLPGLDEKLFPGNIFRPNEKSLNDIKNKYYPIIDRFLPSYYVDLDLVRKENDDYLSLLSSNTRYQIKKAIKRIEIDAPLKIEEAQTIQQGWDFFDELMQLHKKKYDQGDIESNFDTDFSIKFHHRLIEKRLPEGEIQLLKISCGNRVVGCLYNFVYKRYVYFFQSGINYAIFNQFKPGLICQVKAIMYNANIDNQYYDFLAGNEQYKVMLGTNHRNIIWARIQKRKIKFKIEILVKNVIKHLKN